MMWNKLILAGLISVSLRSTGLATEPGKEQQEARPKNIILMIGDGMGVSEMSAAFYYGNSQPAFSQFPVIGLITTSSSSHKITDSAAGATAFSTGKKTKNESVGIGEDGKDAENLVEYFSEIGKRTGIVATSSITHATPAAFYAHVDSRHKEEAIASFLPASEVDFFAGGGRKFFSDEDHKKFMEHNFEIYNDRLRTVDEIGSAPKAGFLLAEEGMPPVTEGRGDFLKKATALGLSYLSGADSGFFMMIEGSQIDWGGHANDGEYLIQEVLDFDRAIGAALDFAEKDGNTLVIVTADHETGGFTLAARQKEIKGKVKADYNDIDPVFSTGGHSATLVPVLAYGPGSSHFSGIYSNTDLHKKIVELFAEQL